MSMFGRKEADDGRWLSSTQKQIREEQRMLPAKLAGTGFTPPIDRSIREVVDDREDPRLPGLMKSTSTVLRTTGYDTDTRPGKRAIENTALMILNEALTAGPPEPRYAHILRNRLEDTLGNVSRPDHGSFRKRAVHQAFGFVQEQITSIRNPRG